jgi:hypothetical protein
MPVIVNPFQGTDPTAQAFSDVGNAIFGNTGQAALRQQQIIDAQRKNTETLNLMNAVKAGGGAQNLGADPTAQSEMIGAGYDPSNFGKLGLMGAAVTNGAASPVTQNWQVGTGQSYDNTAAAANAKLANATSIAGNEPLPAINASGAPVFTTKNNTAGFAPVLSDAQEKGLQIGNNWNSLQTLNPNQQAVIGAAKAPGSPQTPRNYVAPNGTTSITYDGITDAGTGQKLPPGGFIANAQGSAKDVGIDDPTNAMKTDIQKTMMAQNQFMGLSGAMMTLADQHPEAFGMYGKVAGGVQELAQSANVLITQMGGGEAYKALLGNARSAMEASGASSDVLSQFNPSITAVDTLGPVLAASAANAVAQQTGRSLSDQDYKLFLGVVGDPQGLFSSAAGTKVRMQILQSTVTYAGQMAQSYLSKGMVVPDGIAAAAMSKAIADVANNKSDLITGQPAAAQGAAPAAPAAPVPLAPLPASPVPAAAPVPLAPLPAAPATPTAAPVQIRSAADYAALPPGTHYIDPTGQPRIKAAQ